MASEDSLTVFAEIISYLKRLTFSEYRESNLPGTVDGTITEACELFKAAKPDERVRFSNMLQDKDVRVLLLEYDDRMAMLGARKRSSIPLINGLVALAMMPERIDLDWGDYRSLALLYHSAEKVGSPDQIFSEAAQYAVDEDTKGFILHFPKRLSYDRRLAAFGFHEIKGPHGLIYQYDNQPIPKGLL